MADDPTTDDLSNTSNNLSGIEESFAIPEDQSGSEKNKHKKDAKKGGE